MDSNYTIEYYKDNNTNKKPVREYLYSLNKNTRVKIFSYLKLLASKGRLKYSYAKHIEGKIWELRVDFSKKYHRIFYFIFTGRRIILLHAFPKKTNKTPERELKKAINNYRDFISNN